MLEQELQFYQENETSLIEKYLNKWVVISRDRVIGTYEDDEEAYDATIKTTPLGQFMIHFVSDDPEVNTARIVNAYV
jgi:hypothetical protein